MTGLAGECWETKEGVRERNKEDEGGEKRGRWKQKKIQRALRERAGERTELISPTHGLWHPNNYTGQSQATSAVHLFTFIPAPQQEAWWEGQGRGGPTSC